MYSASSLGTSASVRPLPSQVQAYTIATQPQLPFAMTVTQPQLPAVGALRQSESPRRPKTIAFDDEKYTRDEKKSRDAAEYARSMAVEREERQQSQASHVEQGSFFDFLVHNAQQDEIDEPIEKDFGYSKPPMEAVEKVSSRVYEGLSILELQDDDNANVRAQEKKLPYGMTPEKHEEYKSQLEVFKRAEKEPHEKVELHHVEHIHHAVQHAKAGRLEKDLLHIREDQLERRLGMLERIAHASPQSPHHELWKEEQEKYHSMNKAEISPFMEKFLPVPLGGGMNWHYFNHYEGFYVQRDKIAQREGQLKHLFNQHQHPTVYALAGKFREDIEEDYWERDHRKWLSKMSKPPDNSGYQSRVITQSAGFF